MNPLGMGQPVGLDVLHRLATGYTRDEQELLKRQRAAQRQQMDTGYRAQTPGYNEFASEAAREVVPMAAGALPIVGEAVDTSMGARALQEGRYGDAALHGAGLAMPYVSGPMLKSALAGVGGMAGILAGKTAKTADLQALRLAEQMAEQGENAGKIWELWTIIAVVLGGTRLQGGFGSMWMTIGGVLTLAVLRNGLRLLNTPNYVELMVMGVVLILALTLDKLLNPREDS